MTTRHLVDPELVAMLDQFPPLELSDETVGQIRAMMATMRTQILPDLPQFPEIAVREHFVPDPQGAPDVRVLIYQPATAQGPLPALLWIHGGGYVIGSADQDDLTVKSIVSA